MTLDDPWFWNTDVAGHAWVWDQMRADQLAVVSYTTSYAEMVDLGKMVVLSSTKTYAVRMAAVFMMSLATMWLRTGLMPRWLVGLSYLAAVSLLLASDVSMWITMAFPVWVLVVSGLLLARAGLFEQLRAAND